MIKTEINSGQQGDQEGFKEPFFRSVLEVDGFASSRGEAPNASASLPVFPAPTGTIHFSMVCGYGAMRGCATRELVRLRGSGV